MQWHLKTCPGTNLHVFHGYSWVLVQVQSTLLSQTTSTLHMATFKCYYIDMQTVDMLSQVLSPYLSMIYIYDIVLTQVYVCTHVSTGMLHG